MNDDRQITEVWYAAGRTPIQIRRPDPLTSAPGRVLDDAIKAEDAGPTEGARRRAEAAPKVWAVRMEGED